MWLSQGTYDRMQARQYAERWWNSANPSFRYFDDNCTNFVSQCMLAGGFPMDDRGRQDAGWWYRGDGGAQDRWSYSWAVAHSLYWYLAGGGTSIPVSEVAMPQQLQIGDVICYDWSGNGRWGHTTIVTGHDPSGEPLVAAQTANSFNRPWQYLDSHAHTPETRYKFFHIG